jgi:hypothetical protein
MQIVGRCAGTAIDVAAKSRRERVFRISVTADIYPVVQIGWHDDSMKQLIRRTGPTGSPEGEVNRATQ